MVPRQVTYDEFPGFEHVYLEDSYVLDVTEKDGQVEFDLDVVLLEGHPLYRSPGRDEQHCVRRATLEFPNVRSVEWKERRFIPAEDAAGEIDYGNIDVFYREDQHYRIAGEWGDAVITSGTPRLVVSGD